GLTRATYDAMASTARQVGIRFGGHVPADVGLAHAIESGQDTFDHLDGFVEFAVDRNGSLDAGRLMRAVEMTRAAGAAVVPTMALWEVLQGALPLTTVTAYPELKYMPRAVVQQWTDAHRKRMAGVNASGASDLIEHRMRILDALHEGNVTILLGTDAPQQF